MAYDLGSLGQQTTLSIALLGIGVFSLASVIYTLTRTLLSTFVLPGKSLSTFGPQGSWAIVTGASDGLGKEFASQLAARGFNLILASRTQSKLDDVAKTIKSKHASTQVETLAIDFSKPTADDYRKFEALLVGRTVAILINNVGQSHSIPVPFAETESQEIENIININCQATLRVTQLVLPQMLPNKKGLILTMGSFGGLTPTPLLATYSGSKAFLQQWSNALASELEDKGITVHFVQAYLITSAMSKIKRASLIVPSERAFVKSALSKIGRRGGSVGYSYSGSPYWSHAVAAFGITYLLGPMNGFLLGINKSMHVDIRKRALRKAERDRQQGKKESYFTYAPNTQPSIIDHDVHFRPGIGSDGRTETYTPRTIIYDLKGGFGTLRQRNVLYDDIPANQQQTSTSAWSENGFTTIKQQPIQQNRYQQDLDAGLPTRQLKSSDVRYWSDFNRVFFHPRSIVQLSEYTLNDSIRPFENWAAGEDLWRDIDRGSGGLLDRDVRLFVEECDSLQGFQLYSGVDDAWGGWCSRYVDALRDEFGKKSVWVWALEDNEEQQREKRIASKANAARSMSGMRDLVNGYIGLSSRPENLPGYTRLGKSEWESTGLIAAAVESVTLAMRLRSDAPRTSSMAHFEQVLGANEERNMWQLGVRVDSDDRKQQTTNGQTAASQEKAEDEADAEDTTTFDINFMPNISSLMPNTLAQGSRRTGRKHIFAQINTSRTSRDQHNDPHPSALSQEELLRRRYNEEAIVESFHVPLGFPRLDAYPAGLFDFPEDQTTGDRRKISLTAGFTTSSKANERILNLRDLVTRHSRAVAVDDREELYNGLTEVAQRYAHGWDSGSESEDD
ncbi:hypothetical protein LTR64_001163 [Lithohypha guttulata]|uniref:uncharacterized protein n=1 Tax=Lithohypha guttulata TaxID=1690604 RepID=UPI002DDDF4A6|nr:hypothetical protein LTR51_003357 [Lithohypha guttulata]